MEPDIRVAPSYTYINRITVLAWLMDDILLLWSGTAQAFTDLLAVLNSMFPTIKFATKFGGKAINFLDVITPK